MNITFVLYLKGCPFSAWREETNYYLCAIIVILVFLQTLYLGSLIDGDGPSVQYRQLTTGKK